MIQIFICDDQKNHLDMIRKVIENKIVFSDVPMKVALATTNPIEIIKNINPKTTNVYFLDIDLNSVSYDGLKLGVKIRSIDVHSFIIFITSHLEFGMLTFEYKLGAFDYIVKTSDKQLFANKIDIALKAISERYQTDQHNQEDEGNMQIKKFVSNHEEKHIPTKELIMLEVVGNHKIKVLSKHQIFECYGTLGSFIAELPDYFFRINRSIIINLKMVVNCSTKKEIIMMSNGVSILCSRRQLRKLNNLLDELTYQ